MPTPTPATIAEVEHHRVHLNGTELHYVTAGTAGSPVVLVHGFPETWWTFHQAIPLLAARHRVVAVDLRGFGDSSARAGEYDSATSAGDLLRLIEHLGLGSVHLTGQDISGGTVFRLAAHHPQVVRSFTGIEMGLAGFGLEGFADVTHGGSWHIGVLASPEASAMLLPGRERELIGGWAYPAMAADPDAVSARDIDEFCRTYSRPDAWRGAGGLYRSMLAEGAELRTLAATHPLAMPVLAVGGGGGEFTATTLAQVSARDIRSVQLDGVGHYVALEAPERLADALLEFFASSDAG